jgi:hypothetical protein
LSRRPGTWALLPGNCPAGFERPLCQWFGSKGLRALRRPPPREAEDLSGPAGTAARAGVRIDGPATADLSGASTACVEAPFCSWRHAAAPPERQATEGDGSFAEEVIRMP